MVHIENVCVNELCDRLTETYGCVFCLLSILVQCRSLAEKRKGTRLEKKNSIEDKEMARKRKYMNITRVVRTAVLICSSSIL